MTAAPSQSEAGFHCGRCGDESIKPRGENCAVIVTYKVGSLAGGARMPNKPDQEGVAQLVVSAFENNPYPGDAFLLGSCQGCEPFDEVLPFQGKANWKELSAQFLDERAGALHFFSEAGLRFFLPAFLIADLRDELKYAEPVFTLTSGFSEVQVEVAKGDRKFLIKSGRSQLVNPRLYGASTFFDYARHRLSIFTREEAKAIVAYLEYKQDREDFEPERIEKALSDFWRERTRVAPQASELRSYITDQEEYLAAVREDDEAKNPTP